MGEKDKETIRRERERDVGGQKGRELKGKRDVENTLIWDG